MFHKSREAFDCEAILSAGSPGDVLTPAEVKAKIHLDADSSKDRGWQVLSSCIPRIEKQTGLCWRWDRTKKLWKCLTDHEKPSDMSDRVRRMHSHAKRNERILDSIDLAKLDEADRKEAIVLGMVSSVVRMSCSKKARNAVAMFANQTPTIPDESTLMRLFVK